MNRFVKKILFLLLSTLSIVQLGGCEYKKPEDHQDRLTFNNGETENYWGDHSSIEGNTSLNDDVEPKIDITVIGGNAESEISKNVSENDDIVDVVFQSVIYNLKTCGFQSSYALAMVPDDSAKSDLGILYYFDDFDLFDSESYHSAGFYEVKQEKEKKARFSSNDNVVIQNLGTTDDDTQYLYTFTFENVQSDHFVFKNKYVQYYLENDDCIRYKILDNYRKNYDLTLGSLYDYDHNQYIYDESIFGEYTTHSGESIFSDTDYKKLKDELSDISEQQLKNGYKVSSYQIVYISPESIQAYINSKEEETFFGFDVDELTEEFGLEKALEYTSEGFKEAQVLTKEDTSYNWKSFLTKIGIGCGIILVGAILAPITGGTSFGCALLTISKYAITYALASAVGNIAIKAVEGLISGKTLTETLKDMVYGGLDSFADGFMIGAAVGSVGLLTGKIKPSACFVSGTPVIVSNFGTSTAIENIEVGDYVWSYDEETKTNSYQKVTTLFEKEVDELVDLTINANTITTTRNHPFYLPNYDTWVSADSLRKDDEVLMYDGGHGTVQSIEVYECPNTTVYNFTVENNHTYYVGKDGVLVHNSCNKEVDLTDEESNYWRSKAGKTAKKEYLDDIIDGNDYHGLDISDENDRKIIDFIKKYKRFPSFANGDGIQCEFAHGIDVNKITSAYKKGLLSKEQWQQFLSNPQNGVLTSHSTHFRIFHGGKWTNVTNTSTMITLQPNIESTIMAILQAIGGII